MMNRVRLAHIGELPLASMTTKQAETYIAQEYRQATDLQGS